MRAFRTMIVEVGQVWRKKRDPSVKITITKKKDNLKFMGIQENNECHSMTKFSLWKYWFLDENTPPQRT